MGPLITLAGVAVTTDANSPLLDDINLQIDPGKIVSVIGPNGAGKSTLIRVMAGLQPTARGQVQFRPNLRIGFVPQTMRASPTLPITTQAFLQLHGRSTSTADLPLAELGIEGLLDRPLQALSGGEMRRVLLARALARQPDLLLLDEPTAGVDLIGQVEFYQLLARLRDQYGCALVIVSHDLHFVMAATDQVLCLDQGLVCCHGAPEDVSQHPEYQALFGAGTEKAFAVFSHAMGGHQHAHAHSHPHGSDHIDSGESMHG